MAEHKFNIGDTIYDPDNNTFTFHINKIEDGKYIENDDAWVLINEADKCYEKKGEVDSNHLIRQQEIEEAANEYVEDEPDGAQKVISKVGFIFGAEWADSHAWKPADGDDLPEIDREVVVLYQHYPLDVGEYSVGFAHRPPEYWDGKNIGTGVVTRYYPKKYGKGGWSSPDVKWWLDLDLPKPKVEE